MAANPELVERRRRLRNATSYRSQKRRRVRRKELLVAACGGRCADCGYEGSMAALDFHHRDASTKAFAISTFSGSYARLVDEAKKCDLVCAVCHRIRHALEDASIAGGPVVNYRRRMKVRAVRAAGGSCEGCGRSGPVAIFEFHHLEADGKDFGISQDGIPRPWPKVLAELAKCAMLCANCHREVHAGVRELDAGLNGLAEDAVTYAA
jgi:hypothetical protein